MPSQSVLPVFLGAALVGWCQTMNMVAPAGLEPAPPLLAGAQPGITRNYEFHVAVSLQFGVQPTDPVTAGSRRTANLVIKSVAAN